MAFLVESRVWTNYENNTSTSKREAKNSEIWRFGKKSDQTTKYIFQANNRNTRKRCKVCSELTMKIPERCQWRRSGDFFVKFECIFLTPFTGVFIVHFEQVLISVNGNILTR